jgi:glycosyltransferase involved in cell wall biosynthesis
VRAVDVTVVIPTRDRAAILRRSLEALLVQDYGGTVEVLVADDGSTTDTRQTVEAIVRMTAPRMEIRCLTLPRRTANAARNAAIQASNSRIVVLSDDDVIAPPGWLRALTHPLDSEDVEATTGPVVLEGGVSLPGRHWAELSSLVTDVRDPEVLLAANLAVRREVFERGLFDPDVQAPVEETEWMARVRPRWRMVPEAAVVHAKNPASLRFWPLLRVAWRRGLAGGAYGRRAGQREVAPALATAVRAIGHAARYRCAGGLIIAVASAGRAVGALRG